MTKDTHSIHWMLDHHITQVSLIERLCFKHPWMPMEFHECCKRQNVSGRVVLCDKLEVIGFLVYELFPEHIEILNIAVHPFYQRRGIGKDLYRDMQSRMNESRNRIIAHVTEDNLDGHLFFKSMGCQATEVVRNYFCDESDAYLFSNCTEVRI